MRRWLAVVSISAGAHLALAGWVPLSVSRSASDDRGPPPHVELELIAAREPLPPSEGTKEVGGGDEKGGDPAPEAPVRDCRGVARGPGDAETMARAYALAIADATRALGGDRASPFDLDDGTDAAPPISQMGGTLAGVEQLGHAPARGCPPGVDCGASGARGVLDVGLGAVAPRRSMLGIGAVGTDPCGGMHVCPRQRYRPPPPFTLDLEVRGPLSIQPTTALRRPLVTGLARCAAETGPPGPYPLAVTVSASGTALSITKLAPALESPRMACLAALLAAARFPIASSSSAILARITLRP